MKTTVDIAEPILAAAKETAHREGTTLRSLVEEGLQLALKRREHEEPFRLRDASVGGRGLRGRPSHTNLRSTTPRLPTGSETAVRAERDER